MQIEHEDKLAVARAAAGTAAVALASYRALARWQAASSLLAPHEQKTATAGDSKVDKDGVAGAQSSAAAPTLAGEPKPKPLQRVNHMLLQNALFIGHMLQVEPLRDPSIISVLKANGLYSAIGIICRDASRALFPAPRVVSLRKRDFNAPMQGRYDLVFSDPPSAPLDPWHTDNARTLFGVACAVGIFIDAYHGGQAYVPGLTAALVLMLATHWVIPEVRMKYVVVFAVLASMGIDCFMPLYRGIPGAIHWKDASSEAEGTRPWLPIFAHLARAFQYAIPGIFMTVQLRYEYAIHQRATLRRAKDLGITPKRVTSARVPGVRLTLYPTFSACLLALAVVPLILRQFLPAAMSGSRFGGEASVATAAVLAVAAIAAALRGDLAGWLEYHEVWQPTVPKLPTPETETGEIGDLATT